MAMIGNVRKVTGSASLTVGTDLLSGEITSRQPTARVIKGLAICGSAAAADMIAELVVNGQSYGKFENSSTGLAIDMQKDLKHLDVYVPANALVELIIRDAGGTNDAIAYLEFGAARATGGYRRRSYTPRSGARRTTRRASGGMY